MTDATEVVRYRDFSVSPEPITFKMEEDEFRCLPDISLDLLMELAEFATEIKPRRDWRLWTDDFNNLVQVLK